MRNILIPPLKNRSRIIKTLLLFFYDNKGFFNLESEKFQCIDCAEFNIENPKHPRCRDCHIKFLQRNKEAVVSYIKNLIQNEK